MNKWVIIEKADWALLTPKQIAKVKADAKKLHKDPILKKIPIRQLEDEFIQHAQAKATWEADRKEILELKAELEQFGIQFEFPESWQSLWKKHLGE